MDLQLDRAWPPLRWLSLRSPAWSAIANRFSAPEIAIPVNRQQSSHLRLRMQNLHGSASSLQNSFDRCRGGAVLQSRLLSPQPGCTDALHPPAAVPAMTPPPIFP